MGSDRPVNGIMLAHPWIQCHFELGSGLSFRVVYDSRERKRGEETREIWEIGGHFDLFTTKIMICARFC